MRNNHVLEFGQKVAEGKPTIAHECCGRIYRGHKKWAAHRQSCKCRGNCKTHTSEQIPNNTEGGETK